VTAGAERREPAAPEPASHTPSELELGRRAYRRRQTTRSVLLGAASTVVFAAVIWLVLINTPGWAVVQTTFFDPESWVQAWPRVFDGFLLNLRVLAFALVGVAVLGTLIAVLRTLRGGVFFPLRALAIAYTDLFRGLPLIIVLYLIGFGVPALGFTDQRIPFELLGTAALVLTYSAYVAEVLRAGLESVTPAQRLAARSLGLSHGQTLRIVLLPQAVRNVTPALMNDVVSMQKDVGLISVLGAVDAVRAAQIETASVFDFTPYVIAGVLFVLLAIPTIRLTDWWSARLRARERAGVIV
jgi:polar amino acid transport system permease protein